MYMQCIYCGNFSRYPKGGSAFFDAQCKIINLHISQMVFKQFLSYKSKICQECTMHMSSPSYLS
jgi:hypothetical protein